MSSLKKIALSKLVFEVLIIILNMAFIINAFLSSKAYYNWDYSGLESMSQYALLFIIIVPIFSAVNVGLGIAQTILASKCKDSLSIVSGVLAFSIPSFIAIDIVFGGIISLIPKIILLIVVFVLDIIVLSSKKVFIYDNANKERKAPRDNNPFNNHLTNNINSQDGAMHRNPFNKHMLNVKSTTKTMGNNNIKTKKTYQKQKVITKPKK